MDSSVSLKSYKDLNKCLPLKYEIFTTRKYFTETLRFYCPIQVFYESRYHRGEQHEETRNRPLEFMARTLVSENWKDFPAFVALNARASACCQTHG